MADPHNKILDVSPCSFSFIFWKNWPNNKLAPSFGVTPLWEILKPEFHINARERSFEQGNVFTGVCLSTGGGLSPVGKGPASRGVCLQGGGLHPRGLQQGEVCIQGGLHPGGWQTPLRAVHILLECFLVTSKSSCSTNEYDS